MRPAPDLETIAEFLEQSPVSLVGILFAPPYTKVAAEKIVPRIAYFNERIGPAIHFFCAGYGIYNFSDDLQPIGSFRYRSGDVLPWGFSHKLFARFVNDLQSTTHWKYSGEADLILLEPVFGFAGGKPKLDFSEVIILDLEAMVRDGAIEHVPGLFERLTDYAQSRGFEATAAGLSNQRGLQVGAEALTSALIESLPKPLKGLWKRGVHYRIQNIAAR